MVFPTSSPRSSPRPPLLFLLCSLGPIQMFPATTTLQKFTKRERVCAASCRLGWKWRRGRVGAATSAGLVGGSGHIQRIRHIRHPLESLSHSTPCLGSVGHGRGASGFTDSLWPRWGGPGQAVTEQKPGHWSRPGPRFRLTWHHTSYVCTYAVEVVAGALTKISLPPEQASTVPDQALE